MDYFSPPRPRVFGHRGAAGVAPENTLPSFALAAALGAEYLELDVHGTRDGVVVVLHDPTLERTTEGIGPVAGRTWAEVAALDGGYRFSPDGTWFPYRGQGIRIPTLESVLRAFPHHRFNIEIKQASPPIIETVLDLLSRAGATDRTLLAAEHDEIMHSIRAAAGGRIATGTSAGEVATFIDRVARGDLAGYVHPGQALQIPTDYAGIDLVTPATIAAAHRLGCEMHVWTVNDTAEIERLLDLGVDGLMSDLPGLVHAAVARRTGP